MNIYKSLNFHVNSLYIRKGYFSCSVAMMIMIIHMPITLKNKTDCIAEIGLVHVHRVEEQRAGKLIYIFK